MFRANTLVHLGKRIHNLRLVSSVGIGLGIAKCLARDGYDLVLGYSSNKVAADSVQAELEKAYGGKVVVVGGDIAAAATMQAIFDAVQAHFDNNCTAFVHNAGLYVGLTTATTEHQPAADDDFGKVWDYYQKVYPQAFKRGLQMAQKCSGLKHVVTVSSPGCNINYPPRVGYESPGQAKAAVEFLTRVHASALAKHGINVNCIIPGYTKTEAWDAVANKMGKSAEEVMHFADKTPAQRWCDPTEIGDAVAFLCSSRGCFITGVSLPVDGGLHLQHG